MKSSTTKRRDFPALMMTALFVGASLGTTASLRVMTPAQTLPKREVVGRGEVPHYPTIAEYQRARLATARAQPTNH